MSDSRGKMPGWSERRWTEFAKGCQPGASAFRPTCCNRLAGEKKIKSLSTTGQPGERCRDHWPVFPETGFADNARRDHWSRSSPKFRSAACELPLQAGDDRAMHLADAAFGKVERRTDLLH